MDEPWLALLPKLPETAQTGLAEGIRGVADRQKGVAK
jgi:hypothetical protein